jgi:hypothetical protein
LVNTSSFTVSSGSVAPSSSDYDLRTAAEVSLRERLPGKLPEHQSESNRAVWEWERAVNMGMVE